MGKTRSSTAAALSLADTHDDSYPLAKERLPDLCPVNFDQKRCCEGGLKPKELDDSSERTNDEQNENSTSTMAFWESLFTSYIPFFLQSFFSGFQMISSAIVTYVFYTLLNTNSWEDSKLYRTVMLLFPEGAGKYPSSPPPSLVFLALLTVTALVVHPDGFTWIALRKLR